MTVKTSSPFGSAADFATFGKQTFAYVRPVRSDEMNRRFPRDVALPEGLDLWGLFDAGGQPIAVASERGALLENAQSLDLMTLARH